MHAIRRMAYVAAFVTASSRRASRASCTAPSPTRRRAAFQTVPLRTPICPICACSDSLLRACLTLYCCFVCLRCGPLGACADKWPELVARSKQAVVLPTYQQCYQPTYQRRLSFRRCVGTTCHCMRSRRPTPVQRRSTSPPPATDRTAACVGGCTVVARWLRDVPQLLFVVSAVHGTHSINGTAHTGHRLG